ncbi:MAG: methyltransferase domain-containing protein [Proteobacteria bacterium]|nr:methyltransferase domain-containing protein [Pseudomonadota bacterium]
MRSWTEFWAGPHGIYVNERHLRVHCARVAVDLASVLGSMPGGRVLDFGCGDALSAPALSAATKAEILLYDAVPAVRERVAARYPDTPGLTVLDAAAWERLPAGSLDAIVVVSVVQYMAEADLAALLRRLGLLLKPGGALIVGDVIPPDAGLVADLAALLVPAARHGFFTAAVISLARLFFSDYRRLRARLGLTCYSAADFERLAASCGLIAERLASNIGFNQKRMSFRCRIGPSPRIAAGLDAGLARG